MRCVIWNCIPCLGLDFEEEGRGSEIKVSVISNFPQVCICSHTILFSKSKPPPHLQKCALYRLNHFDSVTAFIYMWLYASDQITADACRTHEYPKTKTLPMSGNHRAFTGNKCSLRVIFYSSQRSRTRRKVSCLNLPHHSNLVCHR